MHLVINSYRRLVEWRGPEIAKVQSVAILNDTEDELVCGDTSPGGTDYEESSADFVAHGPSSCLR